MLDEQVGGVTVEWRKWDVMVLNEIRKPARRSNADVEPCFDQPFTKGNVGEDISEGAAGEEVDVF